MFISLKYTLLTCLGYFCRKFEEFILVQANFLFGNSQKSGFYILISELCAGKLSPAYQWILLIKIQLYKHVVHLLTRIWKELDARTDFSPWKIWKFRFLHSHFLMKRGEIKPIIQANSSSYNTPILAFFCPVPMK